MRRFRDPSPERIATVVVGGGALLATAMVFLAGFVPRSGSAVTSLLYLAALALPLVGGLLVLGALRWAIGSGGGSSVEAFRPPRVEEGGPRDRPTVGTERAKRLEWIARARYDCRATEGSEAIRDDLIEGAVRVARTSRGLDAASAREAVRSGTWTDDPVAAAFLAAEPAYPVIEWLRGAVDPGEAYRRRVRRTIEAIESLDAGGRGESLPEGDG